MSGRRDDYWWAEWLFYAIVVVAVIVGARGAF